MVNYDVSRFSSRLETSSRLLETISAPFHFASYPIDKREVFFVTKLSYAFVNYKPILPGHVLVSPRRIVSRFIDLTEEEVCDLWMSAQAVGAVMETLHKSSSLTLSIQDGMEAGQTVPHTHIHVIPRFKNDFSRNDEIYEHLDKHDVGRPGVSTNAKPDAETERLPRTEAEMYSEAMEIRSKISQIVNTV